MKQEFIAIDGDDVGILLRNFIIKNDTSGITDLSGQLSAYFVSLCSLLAEKGYKVILCAGDSLLAYLDLDASQKDSTIPVSLLQELPKGPCTISVGIGATPEYAYLALQLAKARGKKQAVRIDLGSSSTIFNWS
jgi:hypothetical protein